MKPTRWTEAELLALLDALREQTITHAEWERLTGLLAEEPAARQFYLSYMGMVGHLRHALEDYGFTRAGEYDESTQLLMTVLSERASQPASPAAPIVPAGHLSSWGRRIASFLDRPPVFSLIFAASALFAFLTLLAVWRLQKPATGEPAVAVAEEQKTAAARSVAQIVRSTSEDAAVGSPSPAGTGLVAGEVVELPSGALHLRFAGGATLVLQGPARFEPRDATHAVLHEGRVSVRVNSSQGGAFVLETAVAEIVDLGTAFDVAVRNPHQTEVQVVEGAVQVRLRQATAGAAQAQRLIAGEAVRVDGRRQRIEPLAADERQLAFAEPAATNAASTLPAGLKVHLDAANVNGQNNAGLSSGQPLQAWKNLAPASTSVGDFTGNARLEAEAVAGKPAVVFDGTSDQFRNPATLADAADCPLTIFLVANSQEESDHPHLGRGDMITTRTRDGGWGLRVEPPHRIAYYHNGTNRALVADVPYHQFQLHELVREVRDERPTARLLLNGEPLAQVPMADYHPGSQGTWVGGRAGHDFQGAIAELLLYERLLSDRETRQVRRYLTEKYQLTLNLGDRR